MRKKEHTSVQRFQKGHLFCDRYEIIRQIGYGSVGEVYEVRDRDLERQTVAIKFLHNFLKNDTTTLQRFQNEVFISRQLAHPNIARVYDFASDEGLYFITLEYVSGCNLSEVADSYTSRRLPEKEALYLLLQIAEGLSHAHQNNVIHRDLKPNNVIVEKSGLVKISDFGLAFSIDTDHGLTRTGEMIGSPAYLAPEQFINVESDPRADIYAFGIMAFELLTGKIPFDSSSYYTLAQMHLKEELPREALVSAGVSESLITIIEDCCAKSPAARPANGEILLESLTKLGANGERSNLRLKTIVSQRRQDSRITTGSEAIRTKLWLLVVLAFAFYIIVSVHSYRSRIAKSLVQIERHTGIPTSSLRQAVYSSSTDLNDINELLRLAKSALDKRGNGDVKVFLEGGFNLMERVPDGSGDTIMHKLVGTLGTKSGAIIEKAKLAHALNQRNKRGETPLMKAVKIGDRMSVKHLLRETVRIEESDEREKYYSRKNETYLLVHSPPKYYNKLKASVVKGADRAIADREGNYPIHVAVSAGDLPIVKMLSSTSYTSPRLSESALDQDGYTVLHLAVLYEHEDIVMFLIESGYTVELRDSKGRTPLMLALSRPATAKNKRLVSLLLKEGASLMSSDNQKLTAYDHAKLHNRTNELPR
jgi:serine/threonine protein kinase